MKPHNTKNKADFQAFRPRDLDRIIRQVPAETIISMAKETITDELNLSTPENREQQIRSAKQTIKEVKHERHQRNQAGR